MDRQDLCSTQRAQHKASVTDAKHADCTSCGTSLSQGSTSCSTISKQVPLPVKTSLTESAANVCCRCKCQAEGRRQSCRTQSRGSGTTPLVGQASRTGSIARAHTGPAAMALKHEAHLVQPPLRAATKAAVHDCYAAHPRQALMGLSKLLAFQGAPQVKSVQPHARCGPRRWPHTQRRRYNTALAAAHSVGWEMSHSAQDTAGRSQTSPDA